MTGSTRCMTGPAGPHSAHGQGDLVDVGAVGIDVGDVAAGELGKLGP